LAVFGEPALRQSVNVTVNLNGYPFRFSLTRTLNEGWFRFYRPYVQVKDDVLPPLTEGSPVTVKRITLKEHFTQPPPRYNPRSLLLKMEKEEIGTKATRASTIETLQERKYVSGTDSLVVSDLGFEVTEVLEQYCPTVVSSDMTRMLEERMEAIQQGQETKQNVLEKAFETLKQVTEKIRDNERAIGSQISLALTRARLEQNTIGVCPKCSGGQLIIIRSKKSGKRFVGCSNYFEGKCNITYPLPQIGTLKPLGSVCKSCGSPIIAVYSKRRIPWRLCLNPACPSKGEKKL
jgi:DNA topoisomerase-1